MVPRIRQIQIQNFKSIERAVVDLEPFTAFVGINGAGKSNFVDALAFVRDCLSHSMEHAWDHRERTNLLPAWVSEPASFGFRIIMDLSGCTAEYSIEIAVGAFEHAAVARERCIVQHKGEPDTVLEVVNGRFIKEIPGIRMAIGPDSLALPAASAIEEFRPVYNFLTSIQLYSIDPQQIRRWQKLESGEFLRADGSNAASVLWNLHNSRRGTESAERIRHLFSRAVPGIVQIKVADSGNRVILEFLQDLGQDEVEYFSAMEMSDGTARILSLLLAAYQPRRPSLLIIEEPGATVYPAAAEIIVQALLDAARERQVLITTHSPDILDARELPDEQIRVVTLERGRTIIAPLSQASRWALRERLYTPGELLKIDELNQDVEAAKDAAQQLDLFGDDPHFHAADPQV